VFVGEGVGVSVGVGLGVDVGVDVLVGLGAGVVDSGVTTRATGLIFVSVAVSVRVGDASGGDEDRGEHAASDSNPREIKQTTGKGSNV
jgi:hypothetical protein